MAKELNVTMKAAQRVEAAINDNKNISDNMVQLNSIDWLIIDESDDFSDELRAHLFAHGINEDEYEIN